MKKSFEIAKNIINLIRVALVFFTFFMILYWIFEIAKAPFIADFMPFFNSIKGFVHLFYTKTQTVDGVDVDFSFLVLGLTLLLISWLLKFVVEFIEELEDKYDDIYRAFKTKSQDIFNLNLERSYLTAENKNKNFAFLIRFTAKNLAKDSFYDYNTEDGAEDNKKRALEEFISEMAKSFAIEKRTYGDGAILFFNNIKTIDKILRQVDKNVEEIRASYKEKKWEVNYLASMETYAEESEVMEKCKTLIMLIKLNLKNEILCLSTFKSRYLLEKNQQFFLESKGTYKINREEDVFSIKDREKYTKHL